MKVLLDFNLSPRLVTMIGDLFAKAVHARAVGFDGQAPDIEIWQHARANGFAILTCDADFLNFAEMHGQPPKIIRLESMNYRTREAAELIRINAVLLSEFEKNDRAVLALRRLS